MNAPNTPSPANTPAADQAGDASPGGKLRFGATPGHEGDGGHHRVPHKKISQQTLVMAVVFAVSAAAIFGMRTLGTRAGIAMGGEVVDYTPPDLEKAKSYDRIMAEIARVQSPLDVTLGEFGKSPFMLEAPPQAVVLESPTGEAITPEQEKERDRQRKRAERIADLEAKAAGIKLQSVMSGKRPLARLNGETVLIGQLVLGEFTLTRIEDRKVVLTVDDMQFELTLESHLSDQKTGTVKIGTPGGKK
jgi:hypothetical protein